MSHKLHQNEEALSEVNVIPLADLSLVLLIILMVLTPMISQALIQVSAAKAQAAHSQEDLTPETPVTVSYQPGSLKLNGTLMGSELEFVTRLSQVMGTRRDKSLLFTASPVMTHGDVVHLMDLIRRHGVQNLTILKWDTGDES